MMKFKYNAPFTVLLQKLLILKGWMDIYVNEVLCVEKNWQVEALDDACKQLLVRFAILRALNTSNEGWNPVCFLT